MTTNHEWRHALWTLAIAGAACNSAQPTAAGDGPACGGTAYARGDTDYVLDGQVSAHPGNPATASLGSVVSDATGWTTTSASREADGRWSFPSACGGYYVAVTTRSFFSGNVVPIFIATGADTLDLSLDQLGRSDVTAPGSGTALALDLGGLDAWTPSDDLQLTVAGAGLGFSSLPAALANPPATGAQTLTSALDYQMIASPVEAGLIDGSRGDRAFVTQLAALPADGDVLQANALVRSLAIDDLVMANQTSTPLTGQLAPVAQRSFTSSLQRDAFVALGSAVNPTGVLVESDVHLDVLPTGDDRAYTGGFADLALVAIAPSASPLALDVSYGDPFPDDWIAIGNVYSYYQVTLSVPVAGGAPLSYTQYETISTWDRLDQLGTIAPRVGPVGHPQLDGHDLFGNLSGVAETPTLTWDSPQLGSADYYSISIQELATNGTAVTAAELAELETTGHSLVIPPGILVAGKQYTLGITAVANPGSDLEHQPFLAPFVPLASADALSGVISR